MFGIACDYALIKGEDKQIKELSSKDNPISCGILYNRKKFIKYGMYNPKFRHREEEELELDWDLNIQFIILIYHYIGIEFIMIIKQNLRTTL